MGEYASLSQTKWDCKIYIVFIPKYRRKVLYKTLSIIWVRFFHGLAQQRECKIEGGQLVSNHAHVLTSIPPKYAVSQVVGYIKGRSAIRMYASMK
jgi:putative transposase